MPARNQRRRARPRVASSVFVRLRAAAPRLSPRSSPAARTRWRGGILRLRRRAIGPTFLNKMIDGMVTPAGIATRRDRVSKDAPVGNGRPDFNRLFHLASITSPFEFRLNSDKANTALKSRCHYPRLRSCDRRHGPDVRAWGVLHSNELTSNNRNSSIVANRGVMFLLPF